MSGSDNRQRAEKRDRSQISPVIDESEKRSRVENSSPSSDCESLSLGDYHLDESTIIADPDLSDSTLEESSMSIKDSLKDALKDPVIISLLSDVFTRSLKAEISKLEKIIEDKDEAIKSLEERVDTLEQYTRRNSMRITGIPEPATGDSEDTDVIVQKVGEAEGVDIAPDMIDRSHRVGRRAVGDPARPIIVKFVSYKHKTLLMKARKGLKNRSAASLGFTTAGYARPSTPSAPVSAAAAVAVPVPPPAERIFINDDLTRARAKLAAQARQMKRDKKLQDTWVFDGEVFVKVKEKVIKLSSERHLNTVL